MVKSSVLAGIYEITSPTGKVYVGQSWNILRRFRTYAINKCEQQRKLYNSLVKYGWSAHKKRILQLFDASTLTQECLNRCEIASIEYNKIIGKEMLNLASGGSNGRPCEETREKYRQRTGERNHAWGVKRSKEFCDNRRGEKNPNYGKRGTLNANYGKKQTKERILKTSGVNNYWYGKKGPQCPFYGKKQSKEAIEKRSGANHPKAKGVIDTLTGKKYDTIGIASKAIGIASRTLSIWIRKGHERYKFI